MPKSSMRRRFSIYIHSWTIILGTRNDTCSWEQMSGAGGSGCTLRSFVVSCTLLFPLRVLCCALWASLVRTGLGHTRVINECGWDSKEALLTSDTLREGAQSNKVSGAVWQSCLAQCLGPWNLLLHEALLLFSILSIWRCIFTERRGEESDRGFLHIQTVT